MAKNKIIPATGAQHLLVTTNGAASAVATLDSPLLAPPAETHTGAAASPTLSPDFPTGDVTPYAQLSRASAYGVAQAQLDTVADFMGLADDLRLFLRTPQRELIVHFPVEMDDGHMRIFTGFRVHHNMAKGPTKGGIR